MIFKNESVPIKILVVDDEDFHAGGLEQTFFRQVNAGEYQFAYAKNGKQALEMIQKEIPDLMLLDLQMPDLNGFEVLQELNRQRIYIKTIIITTHGEKENLQEALHQRAFDFLEKPFLPRQLREAVEKTLSVEDEPIKQAGFNTVSRLVENLSEAKQFQLVQQVVEEMPSKYLQKLHQEIPSIQEAARREEIIEDATKHRDKERSKKGLFPIGLIVKSTLEIRYNKYLLARWSDPGTKKLLSYSFKKKDLQEPFVRQIIREKLLKNKKKYTEKEINQIFDYYDNET